MTLFVLTQNSNLQLEDETQQHVTPVSLISSPGFYCLLSYFSSSSWLHQFLYQSTEAERSGPTYHMADACFMLLACVIRFINGYFQAMTPSISSMTRELEILRLLITACQCGLDLALLP